MPSEKRSSCPQIGKDVPIGHTAVDADIEGTADNKQASKTDSIDPHVERRLRWKIDLHVYPILYVVYALSFLDRINISNARIQGLTEDLELYGNRFNVALFVCNASLELS
jgi:hypothetical protein